MRRDRPLHVTLRLGAGLPGLRRAREVERIRSAIGASHKSDFRIVHFSVLSNHVHLVVEADDRRALSRGMQGLKIAVLLYVVGNFRKHAAQAGRILHPRWVDPFSSARQLDGWNQPVRLEPGVVASPKTWMLRTGWRRHGLLDAHAIPSRAR